MRSPYDHNQSFPSFFHGNFKRRVEEEKETRKLIFTAKRLQIMPLEDTEHAKARLGNRWKKKLFAELAGAISRRISRI